MFLKTVLNPYQDGHPTRSVMYRPNATQTYAIDAEQLHKKPYLLNEFGKGRSLMIRMLDICAYGLAAGGIAASFYLVWWMFLPALIASTAMVLANRKTAGMIARKAAANSTEHFLYLHDNKAIWLVTEPAKEVVLEAA